MDGVNIRFLTNFMNAFHKGKDNSETVYLAGPWFTDEQMKSYSEFITSTQYVNRNRSLKYNVFFPYLFRGTPNECFKADTMAIDASDILLAWLDYKDCGTAFEIGYAKAKGKRIIAFVQSIGSLTKSKTNLMLAKSTDEILFLGNFGSFLSGDDVVTKMPRFDWEVIE